MLELNNYKSVVAENHSINTSDKFSFIPTTRVIDILAKQNWFPSKIQEKNVRVEEKRGFQTHLLRFRQPEDMSIVKTVGDMIPEIVVKNAHDGSASFSIMAGIFRLVCTNGMIVADSMFATHKIKHIGFQDQNVIDAVSNVVETTPMIMNRVDEFKQIILGTPEQKAFAEAALIAKYGADPIDVLPENKLLTRFEPAKLIEPIRRADRLDSSDNNTLWNTFNIIQEKLVERGGRYAKVANSTYRVKKARGISSVNENVRVNQALWMLTEKMAALKI
jgi:hypothetical protein